VEDMPKLEDILGMSAARKQIIDWGGQSPPNTRGFLKELVALPLSKIQLNCTLLA
jgi:hypothetical protein